MASSYIHFSPRAGFIWYYSKSFPLRKRLDSNKLVYQSYLSPSFESLSSHPEGKTRVQTHSQKHSIETWEGISLPSPASHHIIVKYRQPMPFAPFGRSGERSQSWRVELMIRVPLMYTLHHVFPMNGGS